MDLFLEIEPLGEAERERVLSRESDPTLVQEVRSLLSHHQSGSILSGQPGLAEPARRQRMVSASSAEAQWEEAQRAFFHDRMRLMALTASVSLFVVLYRALVVFGALRRMPLALSGGLLVSVLSMVVCVTLILALRAPSQAALRRLEAAATGSLAGALFCWGMGWLGAGGAAPEAVRQGAGANFWSITPSGEALLHVGPALVGFPVQNGWSILSGLHGLFVPSSMKRGLLFQSIFVVAAMATYGVAALINPTFRQVALNNALTTSLLMLVVGGGALALNHKVQRLHRVAHEAERAGQYRLLRQLGAGAMGEVYLARHWLLRRPCAIKLIRADRSARPDWLQRFEREVQTMASLSHPNTVEIYDFGQTQDGSFFYAMEFLPGMSLDAMVRQHGPLPAGRVVHLLEQICGALEEAHRKGLVHRDIKPGNLFACERGGAYDVAKLLDFGIVHVKQGPVEPLARGPSAVDPSPTLTFAGQILGTPAYMAPEQIRREEPDGRSDIYSLGCVAYFLLTGVPPFSRATPEALCFAHLHDAPAPLRERSPSTPEDLAAIVERCIDKEPSRRFQRSGDLAAALRAAAAQSPWSADDARSFWTAHPAESTPREELTRTDV